jgi:hypothetical protein
MVKEATFLDYFEDMEDPRSEKISYTVLMRFY